MRLCVQRRAYPIAQLAFPSLARMRVAWLLGLIMVITFGRCYGQAVYGSIYGTVSDKTGSAIAMATVTVTDENRNSTITVKTNESGAYTVQNLIVGTYDVRAEAPGFETSDTPHVQVFVDASAKVDLVLRVGSASQTVTVSAGAPLLKTDNAEVALNLDANEVSDLPLDNRNFTSLQFLIPGAEAYSNTAAAQDPQGSQRIDINGQNYADVGYQLDGTDNQSPVLGLIVINPIPDDVDQAKITTQNFSAEFGAAASAIINVSTKSGTNQIHGTVYDFRTSGANLARNPYTQYPGTYVPPALQNQFGGNIGGPIITDKLFYFVGYQGTRQRTGASLLNSIPTLKAETTCTSGGECDLSDYLLAASGAAQIYDPTTGKAFTNNVIPAARLNPAAVTLLKMFPKPNTGAAGAIVNNFQASGTGTFNANQFDIRMDDLYSANLHLFARYSAFLSDMTGSTIFGSLGGPGTGQSGFGGTSRSNIQSFAGGADYQVRTNLTTDIRLGYHRYDINSEKYDGDEPFATNVGIPGLNTNSLSSGAPTFNVTGVTAFGNPGPCNCPLDTPDDEFQLVDNWTILAGNHIFRFGGDLRYARSLYYSSNDNRAGNLTFASSNTSSSSNEGGLGLATFLLGNVTNITRYVYNPLSTKMPWELQKKGFFFVQDTWHTRPNLTINYGLRYELYLPETVNGKGQGSLLNLNTGNLQVAGYGPYGMNMGASPTYRGLAPRLAFAYQPSPDVVIRAGYGRSFAIGGFGAIFGESATENLPILADQNVSGVNAHMAAFVLGQAPPIPNFGELDTSAGIVPLPDGVTATTRPLKLVLPTVDGWNLAFQEQLTHNLAFTIAYVGNKGTHVFAGQYSAQNPNALALTANGLTFNPASSTNMNVGENPALPISASGDVRRHPYYFKYGWTQSINYNDPSSNSNYNGLQVTVEKRLSHGLQLTGLYAWQRAFDYDSTYFEIDKKLAYEPHPYLRTQSLRVFGTWELPVGEGRWLASNAGHVLNSVIGGWELSTILSVSNGLPWTPSYSDVSEDRDAGPNSAPNIISPDLKKSFTHLTPFNPVTHSRSFFTPVPLMSARGQVSGPFQRPGLAEYSNLSNYSFMGPGAMKDDLALQKRFRITEKLSGAFRMDAFNAFNQIPPANPSSACVDCTVASGAGLIENMAYDNPRQLDFAARFSF